MSTSVPPTGPYRPENSLLSSPQPTSPTLADVFRRYGDAYLATHTVTS